MRANVVVVRPLPLHAHLIPAFGPSIVRKSLPMQSTEDDVVLDASDLFIRPVLNNMADYGNNARQSTPSQQY
jgi:hypothetical protein